MRSYANLLDISKSIVYTSDHANATFGVVTWRTVSVHLHPFAN